MGNTVTIDRIAFQQLNAAGEIVGTNYGLQCSNDYGSEYINMIEDLASLLRNVAMAFERRRAKCRAASRRYADEEDGHRGDIPSPEYLQTSAWSQNLSLSLAKAGRHPTQPGLGNGHNLCSDGSRLRLSLRRRGLVQPAGSFVAAVNHDGGGLLHRSSRGSAGPLWQTRHIQHRPRLAVHLDGLHSGAEEGGNRHLDGWQGCVARQRLRRAALAVDQIRGSLPPRL